MIDILYKSKEEIQSAMRKVLTLSILVVALIAVFMFRNGAKDGQQGPVPEDIPETAGERISPTLLDMYVDSCPACKMMKGILDEFQGRQKYDLNIKFVDLWKDPDMAKQYSISVVPTLIFLDPDGKQIYRHEGVMTEEMLLLKWKELGFDLDKGDAS